MHGRSVLDNFFLRMILSISRKRCSQGTFFIALGRWLKTQNGERLSGGGGGEAVSREVVSGGAALGGSTVNSNTY